MFPSHPGTVFFYDKEAPSHLPFRSLAMTMHGQAMKQFSSPGAQQCSCLGGCGVVVESGARSGFIPGDQDKEPHSAEGTLHFCPLLLLDAVTSFTSPHMDTNRPSFTPKFQGIGGRSPAALEPCSRLPTSFRQAWGSTPITAPLLSARARASSPRPAETQALFSFDLSTRQTRISGQENGLRYLVKPSFRTTSGVIPTATSFHKLQSGVFSPESLVETATPNLTSQLFHQLYCSAQPTPTTSSASPSPMTAASSSSTRPGGSSCHSSTEPRSPVPASSRGGKMANTTYPPWHQSCPFPTSWLLPPPSPPPQASCFLPIPPATDSSSCPHPCPHPSLHQPTLSPRSTTGPSPPVP